MAKLLATAVGLAASLHDIGKLTQGFNQMLLDHVLGARTGGASQPVRHEYLSLLILHHAIEQDGKSSDREFLQAISDPDNAAKIFTRAVNGFGSVQGWAGSRWRTGVVSNAGPMTAFLPHEATHPFMRAVANLVVSHHKLPTGGLGRANPMAGKGVFYNMQVIRHEDGHIVTDGRKLRSWTSFLAAADGYENAIGGAGTWWNRDTARDATRALAVLDHALVLDMSSWNGACLHYGRTALMLGDHQGSNASQPRGVTGDMARQAIQLTPFANTADKSKPDDKSGTPDLREGGSCLADTWQQHTHKVRRRAIAALGHLLTPSGWPCVMPEDMPSRLVTRAPDGSPFGWQDRAVDAIRGAAPESAWLVFLMASTGTGKTVAVPKIAAAISGAGGTRLNVALGLRSLTLQSGDEYLDKVGFGPDQVSVSIGSDTARILHDAGRDNTEQAPSESGADASVEDAYDTLVGGDQGTRLNRLAKRTAGMDSSGDKRRRMLATPILVSTIDRLMSAADARGGGHLGDTLRVSSADLAIDEIDSYDTEDLIAVCRLIRIAAAHGRSVIVASATMRHAHALAVRTAYAAGRRDHAALIGAPAGFGTAWISEYLARVEHDDCGFDRGAVQQFSSTHMDKAAAMSLALEQSAVRRRGGICRVANRSPGGFYAATFQGGLDLHAGNHVVDPATGIRLSVGIVRWNHVSAARSFAAHVAQATCPPGTMARFACYHSRFALSVRNAVYTRISAMLTRKPGQDGHDPLLDDPDIRRHLAVCAQQGVSDLVCYIATTNIVEAGCDLDADWAIAEPCSERSVLQLAGRIRRHRFAPHDAINVLVLEDVVPSRWGPKTRLEKPGVETPVPLAAKNSSFYAPLYPHGHPERLSVIFPMDAWGERIDASGCIVDARSACADAEVALLDGACLAVEATIKNKLLVAKRLDSRDAPKAPAVQEVASLSVAALAIVPDILWTDMHALNRRFRRQTGIPVEAALNHEKWLQRNRSTIDAAKNDEGRSQWVELPVREQSILHPCLYPDHAELSVDSVSRERMLLDPTNYDIEKAACAVELKLGIREGWFSREIRTTSLVLYGEEDDIVFHPWLGMQRKQKT